VSFHSLEEQERFEPAIALREKADEMRVKIMREIEEEEAEEEAKYEAEGVSDE
jgi:hypothetical protein